MCNSCNSTNTNNSCCNCSCNNGCGCSSNGFCCGLLSWLFRNNGCGCNSCCNNGCGSTWSNQRVCRDCCGNLRVYQCLNTYSSNGCASGCGCYNQWNTSNGCSRCGAQTYATTQTTSNGSDAYYASQYGSGRSGRCGCSVDYSV